MTKRMTGKGLSAQDEEIADQTRDDRDVIAAAKAFCMKSYSSIAVQRSE
jgi:hypothetical protein